MIDTLSNVAVSNGAKYIYALIKNPSLINKYEQLGFVKGDSYTSEMIKTIQLNLVHNCNLIKSKKKKNLAI